MCSHAYIERAVCIHMTNDVSRILQRGGQRPGEVKEYAKDQGRSKSTPKTRGGQRVGQRPGEVKEYAKEESGEKQRGGRLKEI